MFSDLARYLIWSLNNIHQAASHGSYWFWAAIVIVMPYTIWRLWRFTIAPALYPREPKQIPYWFPILGHAISFFNDYDATLAYGRKHFGYSNETYKLTFPGRELYLMTSPGDISSIYRNTVELTFDTFVRQTLRALGASSYAVDKWIPVHASKEGMAHNSSASTPLTGEFAHTGERLCQQQLLPGKQLDILQKAFIDGIQESLQWHSVKQNITFRSSPDTRTISLLGWCREVLLESATRAFFGDQLLKIDPDLFRSFFTFDASSWKLHYGYPRVFSKELYAARDAIIEALTAYFHLPKSERSGASFLIDKLEVEMRNLDIEDKDIAALIMPVYWVINANAYKQCFWMMAYILYDQTLLSTLRDEISPAVSEHAPGLEYRLEHGCPRLRAVYHEVLRLTASSSTVRGIQNTTEIGEKVFGAGANILIPYRQLHLNPEIFGSNADQFDPERFLRNSNLTKNPSFRPFGGGRTYCPGRYLAEREILTFVALALHRFDIRITASKLHDDGRLENVIPRFPRLDKRKFCLGIMEPIKGDDLILDIKNRA